MQEPILILGGGVVALAVARNLQLAGRRVELIDPLPSPGGASFGNAGFISPDSYMPGAQPGMLRHVPGWLLDPMGPLAIRPGRMAAALPWFLRWLREGAMARMIRHARALRRLHAPALEEWRRLLGPELFDTYIRHEGAALLFDQPPGGRVHDVEAQLKEEFGVIDDVLTEADIRRLFPGIVPEVRFGVVKKGNAHTVSPPQMLAALAGLLEAEGAVFHRETVVKLIPEDGGWLVMTSTGNHRARDIVVACGIWSARLIAPLGIKVPLESQRGYHAMFPKEALDLSMGFIHRARGVGITPMLEGLRVSGVVEFSGLDGVPDERRAGQIAAQAHQMFPALPQEPQSFWSGHRPATPDSLPVIGPVAKRPGLWLCFGHGTFGMTGAPPSGRLLADMILGRPPVLDATAYSADRF